MLYPILPTFVTQVLGASAGTLAAMEGVATATQYTVQGPSGWISDRFSSRRTVAAAGYLLAALAKPFIGASAAWPQALVGRFADRLATGTRSAARDAMIAASAPPEASGRAFGLEGVGDNLGAFIGPLVAAVLVFLLHTPLRSVFFLAVFPGLASVVLVLLVRARPAPANAMGTRLRLRELPVDYWRFVIATGVFGLGTATTALLLLRAQRLGLPLAVTILVYAGFNLCASIASLPAGYLSDRLGRKPTLAAALCVAVVTYAGFAIGGNLAVVAALFVAYGLFQGGFRAVGKSLAARLSPAALHGTGLGVYSGTVGVSGLVASVIGGQLWDRVGPAATFWYAAAVAALGVIALLVLVREGAADEPSAAG